MLEFNRVGVRYGRTELLDAVSLRAESGQITVLLGKNGSGKSTLLRAAAGDLGYTGEIYADGRALRKTPLRERARLVARMPQVLPLPPVTVRELAGYGRSPYLGFGGVPGPEDRRRTEEALRRAGVLPLAERRVSSLSGGERQRAFFAMLAAQDAGNVLLDEPTANLDTEYRQLLMRDVRGMRDAGKAVLIVLHHLSEAVEMADRICVLHRGAIRFSGTPSEFTDSGLPQEVFHMRPVRVRDEDGAEFTVFKSLA